MTNVVHLPVGKLTERELDAQIAANRERYDAACEAEELGLGVPAKRRVCVADACSQGDKECIAPQCLETDTSLWARFLRWIGGVK